jgi:hypothetical protein
VERAARQNANAKNFEVAPSFFEKLVYPWYRFILNVASMFLSSVLVTEQGNQIHEQAFFTLIQTGTNVF